MNNTADNATTIAEITALVTQDVYELFVYNLVFFSAMALLLYAALLRFSQEVEYIWSKRFTIPSLLYLFARYGDIISQGINLGVNFSPLGTACNVLADATNATSVIAYVGTQALLIARAYSLCRGNKPIAAGLALSFIAGSVLFLYSIIAFNGCLLSVSAEASVINLVSNICTIVSDFIIFVVCIWKTWSTWRLKRQIGSQGNDFVSLLFKQSLMRCCFVVVLTISFTILGQILSARIVSILSTLQNALSAILVADFTLELRERNSARIEVTNLTLPTLEFRSVLQHVHQSFLVEIGTPEDVEDGELVHSYTESARTTAPESSL